jgi:hypothetical protein
MSKNISKLFIIVSVPRSGTHALNSILNRYSYDINVVSEVFGGSFSEETKNLLVDSLPDIARFSPYSENSYFNKNSFVSERKKWMTDNAVDIVSGLLNSDSHATVLTIFPNQLEWEAVRDIISIHNPVIVFLRRSMLFSYTSLLKARTNDCFDGNQYKINDLKFDESEIIKYIDKNNDWFNYVYQSVKDFDAEFVDICFSDAFESDNGLDELKNILNRYVSVSDTSINIPETNRQDIRGDESLLIMINELMKLSPETLSRFLKLPFYM